jgi:iron complex outermembrane recepter protein
MKKLLFPVLALISLTGFAQNPVGNVNGKIVDGNQKILASATISLLKAKDSSIMKFSVANKEGLFSFDAPYGKYLVSVTAIGHAKAFSPVFEINESTPVKTLQTIELVPQNKSLATVTVIARKPLIEQKIDRTIVNVEASVANVGSSAMEVIERSPGVSVDKDGNISLKGKEGVMILIDGRPTQLGGTDLANMLRSMHASQLDQIEIMTNPPARYDAAGNAGIINIKTKKNRQDGYNGTLNAGYGYAKYGRFNEGLNLNYKVKKVNVFTNISHNYRKNFSQLNIQRKILDSAGTQVLNYFDQEAKMDNHANSFNAKLGLDYYVTKKTTLGVVFNGFSNDGDYINRNLNLIADAVKAPETETRATVHNKQEWKNFSTNLNMRTVLDTSGKELTTDLDYITYSPYNNQLMVNSYYNSGNTIPFQTDTLAGLLPQEIKIYSGRIDYSMPLKKGARFEAGLKSSIVHTDNNAIYDSVLNGGRVRDIGRSNHFIYKENINAAYVNLSGNLNKKISTQLGLRMENTNADGNQVTTGERIQKNYTQLFPTAYLQYKMDAKNNFSLNYGRRIRRPNYESLNPFIKFLDRYTYQQGNPNLRPQFSNNIELSHNYKNVLTTTLNYTQTHDIIQQVIEQKQNKDAYTKQANLAEGKQFGLALNANHSVTKWWTNSTYVNAFHNKLTGVVNDAHVTSSTNTVMIRSTQQFRFAKTWTAELSGFYRTAGVEGVILIKPVGAVSTGVSKQVLNNKGTLRLNVSDVFKTQHMEAIIKYGNVDGRFQENRDSRAVNLSFSYRFSKGKITGLRKRTSGSATDEQNRAGVGNN